jgi:hypothetical protein
VGIRPRGFPCFLLAGDSEGNAPIGSPLLLGHFPKCSHYSVSIAEQVSSPLRAFPKELPIPFMFCVNGLQELWALFPKCFGIDLGISFTFPSKQRVSSVH